MDSCEHEVDAIKHTQEQRRAVRADDERDRRRDEESVTVVRLDKSGRDVTHLTGLWDDSDRIYEFRGDPIWTQEHVDEFNQRQHDTGLHPMTCGNDSWHEVLVATKFGLVCVECDYRQMWSH